jgi:hypothetical protein
MIEYDIYRGSDHRKRFTDDVITYANRTSSFT